MGMFVVGELITEVNLLPIPVGNVALLVALG